MRAFVIVSMVALAAGALAAAAAGGRDLRAELLAVPLTADLGGATTRPVAGEDAFSFLAANARRERQRPFAFGNRLFNTNWTIAPGSVRSFDGLGPIYNRVSCSGCHTRDGRGQPPVEPGGELVSMLVRLSVPGAGPHGGPRPVPVYGDQLGEKAIPGVLPEGHTTITYQELPGAFGDGTPYTLRRPHYRFTDLAYGDLPPETLVSPRVAPQVIGLGLLESVPQDLIEALADPGDADGDGISGRPNHVWDAAAQRVALGRFGWKANQPSLDNQNAAAALGDIGLTSPSHPEQHCEAAQTACAAAPDGGTPELAPDFLERLTLYTRTLAVPAQRQPLDPQIRRGAASFRAFGCAACHMPTLRTGHDAVLPELADQTFHPFTDLLLHDMGAALADDRPDFEATGREWRTPPLWGLGLIETVNGHLFLLHDGRARGPAEAILWHGGEAAAASEAFRTAPAGARDDLIAFLLSL